MRSKDDTIWSMILSLKKLIKLFPGTSTSKVKIITSHPKMQKQTTSIERTLVHGTSSTDITIIIKTNSPIADASTYDPSLSKAIKGTIESMIGSIGIDGPASEPILEPTPEPAPEPASEPASPPPPKKTRLEPSDYVSILTKKSTFFDYNSFSIEIFNESMENKAIRDAITSGYYTGFGTNVKPCLKMEHVAAHLEIKTEDDCEFMIKALSKNYGSITFGFTIKTIAAKFPIMDTFIKNGTNFATIECVFATSIQEAVEFLVEKMGLMTSKINLDVFKAVLSKHKTIAKSLIISVKHLIKPIGVDNIGSVSMMMDLIKTQPGIGDQTRADLLEAIIQ